MNTLSGQSTSAVRARTGLKAREGECPQCKGFGWVRLDVPRGDPEFGELQRCQVCGGDYSQWLAKHCGLEDRELRYHLQDWTIPNLPRDLQAQREQAREELSRAIEEQVGLLTFWGDYGAGKTFALQITVNELRLQGVESLYAPFPSVLSHLRSLYDLSQSTSSYWQRLLSVPVLALDEVDRFNATSWAKEKLWELADTRYRRRRSHLTLVATNRDVKERLPTSEPLGYLLSRLREGKIVELRGDLR